MAISEAWIKEYAPRMLEEVRFAEEREFEKLAPTLIQSISIHLKVCVGSYIPFLQQIIDDLRKKAPSPQLDRQCIARNSNNVRCALPRVHTGEHQAIYESFDDGREFISTWRGSIEFMIFGEQTVAFFEDRTCREGTITQAIEDHMAEVYQPGNVFWYFDDCELKSGKFVHKVGSDVCLEDGGRCVVVYERRLFTSEAAACDDRAAYKARSAAIDLDDAQVWRDKAEEARKGKP